MKKTKFLQNAALPIIASLLLLGSCGKKYDEAEIKTALDALLEPSFELNEIYFGEGLPATTDQEKINALYGTFAVNVTSLKYRPVDETCGYDSISEIKEATEQVYTDEYAAYLYELAFSGIYSDTQSESESEQNEEGKLGSGEVIESGTADELEINSNYGSSVLLGITASYARYREQNGILTVRNDLSDEAFDISREYRTDSLEITAERENYVIVSVPTYKGGEYDCDVELKLVMTDEGWRLDTPTY